MATLKTNRLYVGLSLILALVFGAFIVSNAMNTKAEPRTKILINEDWHFNGAPNPNDNNPLDPSQYSKLSTEVCDEEPETVCTLNAPENPSIPGQPLMSSDVPDTDQNVSERITEALNSGSPNETVTAFRSE